MVGQQQGRCRTGENLGKKPRRTTCRARPTPSLVSDATERYEPPKLLSSREVLAASGVEAEEFGWQLRSREAWQLGFPAAGRQAFVADGLAANWTIQRRHFPHATPILDLMHALSYAWSAAAAVDADASYRQWAEWIWQGNVAAVIAALTLEQQRLGPPPKALPADDPRERVDRGS